MDLKTKVDFGDNVQCNLTGIVGIVTGVTFWQTGCTRIGIQPVGVTSDGKAKDMRWADEPYVSIIDKQVVTVDSDEVKEGPGGPHNEENSWR